MTPEKATRKLSRRQLRWLTGRHTVDYMRKLADGCLNLFIALCSSSHDLKDPRLFWFTPRLRVLPANPVRWVSKQLHRHYILKLSEIHLILGHRLEDQALLSSPDFNRFLSRRLVFKHHVIFLAGEPECTSWGEGPFYRFPRSHVMGSVYSLPLLDTIGFEFCVWN